MMLALAMLIQNGMQSITEYVDGKKFETRIRVHRIISDQPVSEGGSDAGVTPPELLLAALGACAGHYAVDYLRARSLPTAGITVQVLAKKGAQPARLASFHVIVLAKEIDERHRQGLLRAVKACLIHNTLLGRPAITVEFGDASAEVHAANAERTAA
jgi:putative redox protein